MDTERRRALRDVENKGILTAQLAKKDQQAKRNIVYAHTVGNEEFGVARRRWVKAWEEYERAVEDSEIRYKVWTDAANDLKATNDLSVTAKAIQEARMVFKKYLMENAEINGTFQEAYFTTSRDEQFVKLRNDIEEATRAFDSAVRAHHFDAETIPEYYRWRIADRRLHACWQLTEVAMAEIETIANGEAMGRFAKSEGLQGHEAEVIATAYYARYPMSELHPCLSESLYNSPGHSRIGRMTENNLDRETEVAARITGDKLLAIPMREVHHEIQDRLSKISPERQVELTKEYAKSLGIPEQHKPAELDPPTSAIINPGFSATPEEAVAKEKAKILEEVAEEVAEWTEKPPEK